MSRARSSRIASIVRSSDPGTLVIASCTSGAMRIDAQLDLAHAGVANAIGFRLAQQDAVGLDLDVEHQPARVGQQLEQVAPQQQLAAAEDQEQRAGGGELIEDAADLRGGQLAMIVVIEIAVHAPLVAAVGQIELHRQRHVGGRGRDPRPAASRRPSAHPRASAGPSTALGAGRRRDESSTMPCAARRSRKSTASWRPVSRSTSNSGQTTPADDLAERGAAVRRLPEQRAELVEDVEARIVGREDHHLAGDPSRGETLGPGDEDVAHAIAVQTSRSGVKVRRRRTGTDARQLADRVEHLAPGRGVGREEQEVAHHRADPSAAVSGATRVRVPCSSR